MPDPTAEGSGTARLILRYSPAGGTLLSASLIRARPPRAGIPPIPGGAGIWLIVRGHDGVPIQTTPLPDPRHGAETLGDDGLFRRADQEAERIHAVDIIYPGPGAHFEIYLGSEASTREDGSDDASGGRVILSGALEPGPLRRAFHPDLIEHPGPGAENSAARTLLFLPDGFVSDEMPLFRAAIEAVKGRLLATEPFRSHAAAVRFAHVELVSNESGVGREPRDTPFGSRFTIDRVIEADQLRAAAALETYCGGRSATALICANTVDYGGSGGAATVFSRHPDWMSEIAIHELGHGWFGLADEYTAEGQASTLMPVEPNVSGTAERTKISWQHLIDPSTPLPTTTDEPRGVVGAFEGAKYRSSGIFRPAFDCKMRTPGSDFCPVCSHVIAEELGRHL